MTFPCTKCAACCRRVGLMFPDWPWLIEGTTTCAKLAPDDTCTIYDERPQVCQIDTMLAHLGITDTTHMYQLTAQICNDWQTQDNQPSSYRVKIA